MEFLCTFCWVPHLPPAQPHMIGERCRIACERCYNAVIDLSICWVCGEVIVRGEDVVSLGWCFWHKACFGCLVCLEPLPVEDCSRKIPKNQEGGLELEGIPLCNYCHGLEEGQGYSDLIYRGLGNISRRDGGLSMSRYVRKLKQVSPDDRPLNEETLPKLDVEEKSYPNLGQDGNGDTASAKLRKDDTDCNSELLRLPFRDPHAIYVSIFNPMTELAFRPSPTKPIPKWMELLPGNREREMQRLSTDAHAGSPVSAEFWKPGEDDILDCNSDVGLDLHSTSVLAQCSRSVARSIIPGMTISTASSSQQINGSCDNLKSIPNVIKISPPELSMKTSKFLESRQMTPYPLVKGVAKESEPASYFAMPRRRTLCEASYILPAADTSNLSKTEHTEGPASSLTRERYVPPDTLGWKGKLRDRFGGERIIESKVADPHAITGIGTGPHLPIAENSTGTLDSFPPLRGPSDWMAEVRKELRELFGELS